MQLVTHGSGPVVGIVVRMESKSATVHRFMDVASKMDDIAWLLAMGVDFIRFESTMRSEPQVSVTRRRLVVALCRRWLALPILRRKQLTMCAYAEDMMWHPSTLTRCIVIAHILPGPS